ncbi:DNA-binding transcriptional regulator, LysR family [Salipiger thiooxidans]|uniref:DNA-binding transcriptional regulator, LysR family n=1 Tax=Salipiger thiooxidans TaxID=282683 RepID=A0A1G7FDU1_9RHOB|nr:LysR family transcriptional regulator [Salipiger thiooxidans]SDE74083.1 DNA-binding transcriptional regulator, LysR family [Salipiger thiooxidans]
MDRMNLHRLQVFRTVFETASVSAAARSMRLSQPTVSRHLQIFEDELGFVLFRNNAGRLHPTWEAQRLYAESGGLFDRLSQVEQSVESIRRGQQDALHIMATAALSHSVLPQAVGKLYRHFPELEIVVDSGRQSQQLPALREGAIDLGVGGVWENRPELQQWVIGKVPLVAMVPHDHPRAESEAFDLEWLEGEDFVSHNSHAPLGSIVETELRTRGITPRRRLTALSIPFAVALARGARVCTVIDHLSAIGINDDGMRVLPLSSALTLDLGITQLATSPDRTPVRAFVDAMRSAYAASLSGMIR